MVNKIAQWLVLWLLSTFGQPGRTPLNWGEKASEWIYGDCEWTFKSGVTFTLKGSQWVHRGDRWRVALDEPTG